MISTYKILEDENLIIEVHRGTCNSDSFQDFKIKLGEDPLFHKDFKFLVHIKGVNFKTNMNDIDELATFITKNKKNLGKRKIGILTDTPEQVVNSTLYMTLLSKENNDVQVFSTNQESFKFLNITPNKYELIEKTLKNLKQNLN